MECIKYLNLTLAELLATGRGQATAKGCPHAANCDRKSCIFDSQYPIIITGPIGTPPAADDSLFSPPKKRSN